ncbi:MAG: LysM peptidoglycan-binding domain-containing protein [Thermosynechococcaceae cyanobacterium]
MNTASLEKLKITPMLIKEKRLERQTPIQVLFNPENYSINKSVSWNSLKSNSSEDQKEATSSQFNAPIIKFGGGGSRVLNLKLFFDATVPIDRNGREILIDDIREETNEIVKLTRIQRDQGQPPVCEVEWGQAPAGSDFPFTGVITSLNQEFTQFNRAGKPVRGTLTVAFLEFFDPELDLRKTDPELTTQIIRRGMSLGQIAAEHYHNPKLWRTIAAANDIDDPRRLEAGRVLTIPQLNI